MKEKGRRKKKKEKKKEKKITGKNICFLNRLTTFSQHKNLKDFRPANNDDDHQKLASSH